MDTNAELLNYICQNAEMGEKTIGHLMQLAWDDEFRGKLYLQQKEYQTIRKLSSRMLEARGHTSQELGAMTKVSAYMGIELESMLDRSPSHLSEMMIQGSTMGVIEITKHLNHHKNADSEVRSLALQLSRMEENNAERFKCYL